MASGAVGAPLVDASTADDGGNVAEPRQGDQPSDFPGSNEPGPRLYVVVGIPGSGKTTYVRRTLGHALRVCLDDLRLMLHGKAFDLSRESAVTIAGDALVDVLAEYAVKNGQDLLVDATNVTRGRRARLVTVARRVGLNPLSVFIVCPLPVALERNRRRSNPVPRFVLESFYRRLEPPSRDEGFADVIIYESADNSDAGRAT